MALDNASLHTWDMSRGVQKVEVKHLRWFSKRSGPDRGSPNLKAVKALRLLCRFLKGWNVKASKLFSNSASYCLLNQVFLPILPFDNASFLPSQASILSSLFIQGYQEDYCTGHTAARTFHCSATLMHAPCFAILRTCESLSMQLLLLESCLPPAIPLDGERCDDNNIKCLLFPAESTMKKFRLLGPALYARRLLLASIFVW